MLSYDYPISETNSLTKGIRVWWFPTRRLKLKIEKEGDWWKQVICSQLTEIPLKLETAQPTLVANYWCSSNNLVVTLSRLRHLIIHSPSYLYHKAIRKMSVLQTVWCIRLQETLWMMETHLVWAFTSRKWESMTTQRMQGMRCTSSLHKVILCPHWMTN